MIKVEIKLFGSFRAYHPEENSSQSFFLTLSEEENSVEDVINKIKLPKDEVKIIFVNNVKVTMEKRLKDGDVLGIFPPIAGG